MSLFRLNFSRIRAQCWVPRECSVNVLHQCNFLCCWHLVLCGIHGQVTLALLSLWQHPASHSARGPSPPAKQPEEKAVSACVNLAQPKHRWTGLCCGLAQPRRQSEVMNGACSPASHHLPLTLSLLWIPPPPPPQTCQFIFLVPIPLGPE